MDTSDKTVLKDNEEYHELIDSLIENKTYGEVTLYMQGGNIESCRISQRHTKSEIRELMKKRKAERPRVLKAVSHKGVANGSG